MLTARSIKKYGIDEGTVELKGIKKCTMYKNVKRRQFVAMRSNAFLRFEAGVG